MSLLKLVDEMTQEIENDAVKKREEYLRYIDDHINNVRIAFTIFIKIDWDESIISRDDLVLLEDRIKRHDESKYSDEEFEPYRKYFYPVNDIEKEDCKEEFEEAWKHHYTVNDHHPEFWIKDGVATEMSTVAIAEMICDWQGMSFVKGGSALQFYNSIKGTNNDKVLAPTTRELLELMLETYDRKITDIAELRKESME